MAVTLSPSETERFGFPVYRALIETRPDATGLIDMALPDDAIIIVRLSAGDAALRSMLLQSAASLRYADSLVYYARPMSLPAAQVALPDSITLRPATAADAGALADLARRSFDGYASHYAASPELFAAGKVAEGYGEWATTLLSASDGQTWLAESAHGELAGFIACQPAGENRIEIVLNAVDSRFRRQGIYSALLAKLRQNAPPATREIIVSTQLWNYGVQRAWLADGYTLSHALETHHMRLPR